MNSCTTAVKNVRLLALPSQRISNFLSSENFLTSGEVALYKLMTVFLRGYWNKLLVLMLNINVYSIHFYMMFFYPAVWNWICIIVVSQKAGSSKHKGNLFFWKYNVSISYPLRPLTPHYLKLFSLYVVSLFHAFRVVSHITGSKSESNRYSVALKFSYVGPNRHANSMPTPCINKFSKFTWPTTQVVIKFGFSAHLMNTKSHHWCCILVGSFCTISITKLPLLKENEFKKIYLSFRFTNQVKK